MFKIILHFEDMFIGNLTGHIKSDMTLKMHLSIVRLPKHVGETSI